MADTAALWQELAMYLPLPAYICYESRASRLADGGVRVSWFPCIAYKFRTFLQSVFDGVPDALRSFLGQEDPVSIVLRSHCKVQASYVLQYQNVFDESTQWCR
jgi:hypothetical protein